MKIKKDNFYAWNWLKESLFPSRRQFKLLRSYFQTESFHIYYHLLIAHQSSWYGVLAITVHKKLKDQQSQNPCWASSLFIAARLLSFKALALATTFFYLVYQYFSDLTFLLASRVSTTSLLFHPMCEASSPRTVESLWALSLRTLRASGTTNLFFWSYGYGIPSNTFNL